MSSAAATVACREMGWSVGAEPRSGSFFGDGRSHMPVWELACDGSEASLSECQLTAAPTSRDHANDFGVACGSDRATVG